MYYHDRLTVQRFEMKENATAWSLPCAGNMLRAIEAHESEVATWN